MPDKIDQDSAAARYLEEVRELVLRVASEADCTIFLYGSRAGGAFRRSSDVDIGFCGLGEREFLRLRDRLLSELEESVVPYHVDLVNMDAVSDRFRSTAMEKVIVWKRKSNEN